MPRGNGSGLRGSFLGGWVQFEVSYGGSEIIDSEEVLIEIKDEGSPGMMRPVASGGSPGSNMHHYAHEI